MQFGESRPTWKWFRWRSSDAVDGRDAADRTRFWIFILFYPHRRDVDRAREALETINMINTIDINFAETFEILKPQWDHLIFFTTYLLKNNLYDRLKNFLKVILFKIILRFNAKT